ncbi:ribonuclease R [Pollutibacter soli]|uniref:ribonuclease R n=1 Tax=Pollutibacter soli TaxID=3034157 RepID=UPI003013F3EE
MGRKNSSAKKNKPHPHSYTGILDITKSGMAFVIVDGLKQDILVRPGDYRKAFHGDKVVVQLKQGNLRTGRLQGQVIEILERKQTEFIGHVEVNDDFAFFIPDSGKSTPDFFVPLSQLNGAVNGDRVVVKLLEWNRDEKNPKGTVLTVIEGENQNDIAMKELIVQNGFPLEFSEDTVEESERISEGVSATDLENRKDMRKILTITIDPVDAKDFDDAISFRVLKKGEYEIGVHIADVSHFVETGTALDNEAYERATSVYLPDRVVPMLPERISNELCSLRPKEDKLTYSCIFQMNSKAEIKQYWIGRTIIHSDYRFTYEEVQDIIETRAGMYATEVLVLNDLAQRFRKARFKNGAINFSSQEVRFKLDENNKPIGIVIKESKEAHQLIEEFMLLANRVVAEKVSGVKINKKPIPFPYRVHDQPDEEKLIPFIEFAKKFGHRFETQSPEAIASSFNRMLTAAKGLPEQHVLEQLGIRTMAKAVYTSENIGHYGLGFEHYCHFTSPIRRYPDILVHRILTQVLTEKVKADKKLEEKCKHCSERERAAMETERAANKYKQVEFMSQFIGEEFKAVISGVSSFGFWAETVEHKCEGLVSVFSLQEFDDFRLIESEYCLAGRRSGRTFRIGDNVTIRVIAANLTKRQLDYEWVLQSDAILTTKKKKKGK